jgi:hypothetical protein
MAGAGAAASTLAVIPGKVQAQESAAQAGNGPWSCWGNRDPEGPFVPLEIPRRALRPNDVLIDIMYCAICPGYKDDIQSKVHTNPQAREQDPLMLYRVQAVHLG